MTAPAWTSQRIDSAIATKYAAPEWATLFEVRGGPGWGKHNERRIDAVSIGMWQGTKHRVLAFEVKVSRSDFLRELKDPEKRALAELVACECWFVTPVALVRPDEVPDGWGLYEATDAGLRVRKAAAQRQGTVAPHFALSLVRRAVENEVYRPPPAKLWRHAGRELDAEELKAVALELWSEVAALKSKQEQVEAALARLETERAAFTEVRDLLASLGAWRGYPPPGRPDVEKLKASLAAGDAVNVHAARNTAARLRNSIAHAAREVEALEKALDVPGQERPNGWTT